MDEQSDLFSQLFVQSLELTPNDDVTVAEKVLDNLLKLNYGKRIFAITEQIAGEILCHYLKNTSVILSKDVKILQKYLQLVVHISSSQELVLESNAVNTLLCQLQSVWLRCVEANHLLQGVLDAFAAITYQNGPYITQKNLSFLLTQKGSNLLQIIEDSSLDVGIRRTAAQCVAGLCVMLENGDQMSDEFMEPCMKSFVSALQALSVSSATDLITCRLIFSLAKGLHNILSSSSNVHTSNIGPLLSVLKKYMVFGLPGLSHATTPDELEPVPVPDLYPGRAAEGGRTGDNADTPQKAAGKGQDKKKKRRSRPRSKLNKNEGATSSDFDPSFGMGLLQLDSGQSSGFKGHSGQQQTMQFRPAWCHVTSSESEYSDTEGAQKAKLRSLLSKIRLMCLGVLYFTVRRTDKHTLLGYWSSFLPDSPTLNPNSPSLFTSFRQDTTPKCRAAALGVVGAMCDGSKWFLSLAAEETGSPSQASSFVPFSASLAASIREVHKQLISASSTEQSTLALVQLLKTLSILVSNTPYHKMRPGLLSRIATLSRYYLVHSRDLNVRVACLTLLGAIVSTSVPVDEVNEILTDSSPLPISPNESEDNAGKENQDSSDSTSSWLVDHCIMLAKPTRTSFQYPDNEPTDIHPNLQVASLQTLVKIVKGHLPAVRSYISSFSDLICQCLVNSTNVVRLNTCKLLEGFGTSLLQLMKMSPSQELEREIFSSWSKILSGPLQAVLQDRSSTLQAEACDSLATVGPTVFQALPKNLQILCITLLLGFSSDENALIRSKSVRALGVYIMYPCLREDIAFVEDVSSSVLRLLDDQYLGVRANAAWSLGNLTDTIVINKETRQTFQDEFQSSLLMDVFKKAFQAMCDKDKVRFNMMRVLGNLLRFTTKQHSENERIRPTMLKAVKVLAKMVAEDTMVKVRWNACIACSNFLRNTELPLGEPEWTDEAYLSLCGSLTSCKNYKVRIKAALALSTPTKRPYYGSMFTEVFLSLVQGLEDSNSAADFTEFKFKDTLQDQLCSTLVHLTNIIGHEDIPTICAGLQEKTIEVQAHLVDYHRRISHAVQNDKLSTSSRLNSSNASSVDVNDAVEQYIVAKQQTPQEKMDALLQAVEWVKNLKAEKGDINDNSMSSNLAVKNFHQPNLLSEIFSLENV